MAEPYVRGSVETDVNELSPNLRASDILELKAVSNINHKEVLRLAYLHSVEPKTIIGPKGNVIGMFGVVPSMIENTGCIWCLASSELFDVRFPFLKQCKEEVDKLFLNNFILYNFVDERNIKSIKWLKYMGFNVEREPTTYGIEKRPFRYFYKARGLKNV